MGRTPVPLTILTVEAWLEHPEFKALSEQGHQIVTLNDLETIDPDLILHPAAHRWTDEMWHLLPVALKGARARKKAHGNAATRPRAQSKRKPRSV